MNKINIDNYDVQFFWEKALLLPSLDRVRQFWDEMGLKFENPDQIQSELKQFISEEQKLKLGKDPEYLNKFSKLVNELFVRVRNIEGEKGTKILNFWIKCYISQNKYSNWISDWYRFFLDLDDNQEKALMRLGLPEDKTLKLAEIAQRYTKIVSYYLKKMRETDNEPFTEWDKYQYEIYWKAIGDDSFSPLDNLFIEEIKFFDIWNEITSLLTDEEMEILNQWGQVMAVLKEDFPKTAEIPPEFRKSTMKQ